MRVHSTVFVFVLLLMPLIARGEFQFGFAKLDITPDVSLRLSGYGSRVNVAEGVDLRLFVRVMAIRSANGEVSALASVDTIGFPGTLTKEIAERIEQAHQIPRQRIVVCCTHSHTSPHIAGGLTNILAVPLTAEQESQSEAYTRYVAERVVAAVDQAIEDLEPGKIQSAVGEVGFALNRRAIEDGRWRGFGVNSDGPTDHRLPVLRIADSAGKTRGVVFNYACHCTTFGPGYNRVHGDWAGHAAAMIEAEYAGATALCTIGCGADQNPHRDNDPERALQLAESQGRAIADEVQRLLAGPMTEVEGQLQASFGFAGLPVDRPTQEELRAALQDSKVQVRRHAENMLALRERMGRIPETYPAPVQVWRFGKQLCLVFLGGEVVVDYALRLQKEIESDLVWVTAYANDVFGYVASERVRREGGYEVSGSMIYYNQPGPWAEGTEEVLVRRIHELVEQGSFAGPFTAEESLQHFSLPDGYEIGIVAAEPLIADPVGFAVDERGRLWVVEMGDYPRGVDDQGKPGGRVKLLTDTDGDGRYDTASLFLDGLAYPNGVFPWKNGVLVSGAPEILFAADTDGDGRADVREPLYRGFEEDNPQHRAAGFAYGLDNWLYLASGTNNHEIESISSGTAVNMAGRDLRIDPAGGKLEAVSGRTQFGRNRDDWGNWFGGSNSHPIWHFVLADRYLRRNPFVSAPEPLVHLLRPSLAPPVFPTSRTLDRFNDLFALNRFTSACSPMVFRDETLGSDVQGAAFVSEPVHNLVHRTMLVDDGVTFRGQRHPTESSSEFLSSTDHWFRPTTTTTGPDGALWVADMYRLVIEHPEWIPESWQAKLNLRAGDDRGRIYRVSRAGSDTHKIPLLAGLSADQLVEELRSSNGWRRDTAQRLLVASGDTAIAGRLNAILQEEGGALAKVHALGVLQGLDALQPQILQTALADKDSRVQRRAVMLSEPFLNTEPSLGSRLAELASSPDRRLRLQVASSLGEWSDDRAGEVLARMANTDVNDPWIRAAILSSATQHADAMLAELTGQVGGSRGHSRMLQDLITTAIRGRQGGGMERVLSLLTRSSGRPELWEMEALASFVLAIRRQDQSLSRLRAGADGDLAGSLSRVAEIVEQARAIARDDAAATEARLIALPLLGWGFSEQAEDRDLLTEFLSPAHDIALQVGAVQAISAFDDGRVPTQLLSRWKQLSPQVQLEALNVLLSKREWHRRLVDALAAGEVAVNDLDATSRNRIVSQGNRATRDKARELLAGVLNPDRQKVIAAYRSAAELTGDPVAGAAAFKKTCAACHRHNNIGNDIGASLTALQDKSSDALLISVLDPNRAIEGKYKTYNCVTVDGRVFSGMIVAETTSSITLAQANGTKTTLLRVDIDELQSSGISFMPEGLEKDFSPQDLANIFAFVRSAAE